MSWHKLSVRNNGPVLSFYCTFLKARQLLSSKAAFTIEYFAALNHNYNHKQ